MTPSYGGARSLANAVHLNVLAQAEVRDMRTLYVKRDPVGADSNLRKVSPRKG